MEGFSELKPDRWDKVLTYAGGVAFAGAVAAGKLGPILIAAGAIAIGGAEWRAWKMLVQQDTHNLYQMPVYVPSWRIRLAQILGAAFAGYGAYLIA